MTLGFYAGIVKIRCKGVFTCFGNELVLSIDCEGSRIAASRDEQPIASALNKSQGRNIPHWMGFISALLLWLFRRPD